jgi:hypothetical protein
MASDKLGVTFTFGKTKAGSSTWVKRVNKDIPPESVHDFGDQIFAMLWHCWEAVQLGPLYLCTPERILISALAACESSESKSVAETVAIAAAVFARSQDHTDGNWGEEAKRTKDDTKFEEKENAWRKDKEWAEKVIQAAVKKDYGPDAAKTTTKSGIVLALDLGEQMLLDYALHVLATNLVHEDVRVLDVDGDNAAAYIALGARIAALKARLVQPEKAPTQFTDGSVMVISKDDRQLLDNILYSAATMMETEEAIALAPAEKDSYAFVMERISAFRRALANPAEGCQDG